MDSRALAYLILFLVIAGSFAEGVTYVSEYHSKTSQKLSKYTWFGKVRLYQFIVPEDSVLLHWLFTVTQDSGFNCGFHNVTIHFRSGAPPVINPVGTAFANDTEFSPAMNLTLAVSVGKNATLFNISYPAPGDWFVAAHLPKDDGKIVQKGVSSSCSYLFQPQMFVRRAVDPLILEPGRTQSLSAVADGGALFKFFVPEFSSEMRVSLWGCSSGGVAVGTCPLLVHLGSSSLEGRSVRTINCTGASACSASLSTPPWQTWIRISVENLHGNVTTGFNISANYTVRCKPQSLGLAADDITKMCSNTSELLVNNSSVVQEYMVDSHGNRSSESDCVHNQAAFKEELDVLSVRFTNGANVSVSSHVPSLLSLMLDSSTSGGTLNLELSLNRTNVPQGSVVACLTPWSAVLFLNNTQPCETAFSLGFGISLNESSPHVVLRVPFPQATRWYLTLQLLCPSECENGTALVMPKVYLSACGSDCGTYGECRLLRSYSYLYAACICKVGWSGWSCSDDTTAQTYARQLTATLLLTLSNLFFLPPAAVAVYRGYIPEASVYIFTMFFSTFYHACDQPGMTVLCIMDYDTLQYCDFLGSACSIWVTIVCMTRAKDTVKYMLFTVGTLLIAMSLHLDRWGLWNMMGPILCAVLAMVVVWVYRGVKRRQCYPTTWRRWVLYLLPGLVLAAIGLGVYVFTETDANYYYTHSIWHVMVASCVVFLLPPRESHNEAWGCFQKLRKYQICKNEKEELYTVT